MEQSPARWATCKQCPRFEHVDGNAMKLQLTHNLFTFASFSSSCRICSIWSIIRTFSSISSFVKIGASFFLKISRSFWCSNSLLPGKNQVTWVQLRELIITIGDTTDAKKKSEQNYRYANSRMRLHFIY